MNTESQIASLASSLKPVKPVTRGHIALEAVVVSLLSVVGLTMFHGIRDDMSARMAEPVFVAELLLNIVLVLVATAVAIALSYPDSARGRWMKPTLLASFVGYSALVMFVANGTSEAIDGHAHPHTIECMLCILSYALLPTLWVVIRTRKLAPVRPALQGAVALLMATSIGCFGVRLVEVETASAGVMLWHYMPLILFTAIGLFLGKKIFRW